MIRTHLLFGGRHAGAAVLRSLVSQAEARHLLVSQSEKRVVLAFGNLDCSREFALGDGSVGVVMEFGWIVLAVGVVIYAFVSDSSKGHAAIILEGLPRPQPFFQLLRKHRRISCGLESFLRHLAGSLVIAMAVGASANKNRSDHKRAR